MNDKFRLKGAMLNERQELLLTALYDGECGMISRWRAQRLLARHPAAAEFINTLDVLSNGLEKFAASETPTLEGSLWEGISRRIDQEERAALYLGERVVQRKNASPNRRVLAPLGWSAAGGLVAACFTVLVLNNIQSPDQYRQTASQQKGSGQESSVPLRYVSRQNDLPRIIEPGGVTMNASGKFIRADRQPRVDVDWVHSDGSVRFFSDPNERSTMIWVKKRSPAVRFYTPPTPHSAVDQGVPQLLEKPIPQSLAVSNR